METLKKFIRQLNAKINSAIEEGDVFKANEIASNILLGHVILVMEILTVICWILNELKLFTADISVMRITVIAMVVIETPIVIVNSKYRGDMPYLKGLLVWGLLAVSGLLSATMGHNVTFVMIIPILCSLRYCDALFTRRVGAASIAMMVLATLGNAFFGIVNLNVYCVSQPITLTITDKIRTALDLSNIDHWFYFRKCLVNELMPKLLAFSIIVYASIRISDKGRDLTEMQDRVTKKAQRLETELSLATEIQASMLPCIFPAFPDHGELDLFAVNYPAKEVGGDFYDYFIIDPTHIAIVMADVSGKGVGAALFMTISKIVLKNQLMATLDPALALTNTNCQLCENNDAELFVTCWAGIYDTVNRTMTFANAGHNPPVIVRNNAAPDYLVSKRGFVLAGMETSQYTNCTLELNAGDELLLYTDGVTEANDNKHNLFGEDRLLRIIEEQRENASLDQVNNIMLALQQYMQDTEQFDDITIMAMKIKEKAQ